MSKSDDVAVARRTYPEHSLELNWAPFRQAVLALVVCSYCGTKFRPHEEHHC